MDVEAGQESFREGFYGRVSREMGMGFVRLRVEIPWCEELVVLDRSVELAETLLRYCGTFIAQSRGPGL